MGEDFFMCEFLDIPKVEDYGEDKITSFSFD